MWFWELLVARGSPLIPDFLELTNLLKEVVAREWKQTNCEICGCYAKQTLLNFANSLVTVHQLFYHNTYRACRVRNQYKWLPGSKMNKQISFK